MYVKTLQQTMTLKGKIMARGINKVILIGNLGTDPEVRYMPTGGAVANLTIATSESWTDKATNEKKENTEWHRVVIYQRLAEVAGEYLRKGSKVYIEGRLRTRKWQDQQGIDRYTTEIICSELQMLDSKGQGQTDPAQGQRPQQGPAARASQGAQQRGPQGGAPQGAQPRAPQGSAPQGGFRQQGQNNPMEPPIDFDDDIPFLSLEQIQSDHFYLDDSQ